MDRLRAGLTECGHGDGRDDHHQGHAVLGELEAGQGQDVGALALQLAAREQHSRCLCQQPHTPLLTTCSGRSIAVHFLTLPSKVRSLMIPAPALLTHHAQSELPEYYEHIKLPIAIDTIEVRPHSSFVAY
jgi:hypothetical protein